MFVHYPTTLPDAHVKTMSTKKECGSQKRENYRYEDRQIKYINREGETDMKKQLKLVQKILIWPFCT